jgi:hypothetical protein
LDVAFSVGMHNLSAVLREALRHVPLVGLELADCLAPPRRAYEFPRDLY